MTHRLKQWLITLVALTALAGCGAATPEEAARSACSMPEPPLDYHVLGRREIPQGTIVVATCRSAATAQMPALRHFSTALVQRGPMGWQPVAAGGSATEQLPPADARITYSMGRTQNLDEGWDLGTLSGEILAPDVATVELTFADGETMRENTVDAAYYLFTYPGSKVPCQVAALDGSDQPLEVIAPDPGVVCDAP